MDKLITNSYLWLILLFVNISNAQGNGNLTLVIDGEIITSGITIHFADKDSLEMKSFDYHLGKELNLDDITNVGKLYAEFKYIGEYKGGYKTYSYKFNFKKGWLDNTSYLILRIYNLDKRKFRKAFCGEESPYIIEVQNAVYKQQEPRCGKLTKRF